MLVVLFWGLIGFCMYAYIGYPLLLLLLAPFRQRPIHQDETYTPTLTLIVPAHNEEQVILEKLDNLLAQDYPADYLEVLVASDGSTDGTEHLVAERAARDSHIQLLALPRGGKAAALNAAAAHARGEVLVFTDANAMLALHALRRLARNFADPSVGGVCGNQRYRKTKPGDGAGRGEAFYWRYDKLLKRLETGIGNTTSADGSIYAVRRHLYTPIADPAATDDFTISTRVVIQGFRLIYDPEAVAYENTAGTASAEFYRKARIINRGMRGLLGLGSFLLPWRGGLYAVQIISHKLLRRLVPLLLPILLLANALTLSHGWVYQVAFALQTAFYGLTGLGFLLRYKTIGRYKLFYVPYYFVQANLAAALGLFYLLRNRRITVWQPQRAES